MARRAKAKPAAKKRRVPRPPTPGPALLLAIFALIVAFAGTVYWLGSTYDPREELAFPTVVTDLAPIPGRDSPAAEPREAATPPQSAIATPDPAPAPAPTAPSPATAQTAGEAPATPPPADDAPPQTAALQPAPAQTPTEPPATEAAPAPAPAPAQTPTEPPAAVTAPAPTTAPVEAEEDLQPIALTPAPDPELVKQGEHGPLPIVGPDGRTPLQAYARPFAESGRPRVAIVLGSMGLSRPATIAAIQQLPGPITLAFAPYGRDLQEYVDQARAAGHEVLLQLPMEPVDYPSHDPGPHTLLTSLPARKNLERLYWLLGRITGYVGVVNYMGSRFTASEPHLRPVLVSVRDRGLMFVDARATRASVVLQTANEVGLPVLANDRYIDNEASRRNIDARLAELERLAQTRGQAIGLAFPYPVTIERLSQWSRTLHGKGIDLAPISALLVKDALPG